MTNGLNLVRVILPTVDQLNIMSASRNLLMMLRTLNTSDLAFMYMLFEKRTLGDIIDVCQGIFSDENALDMSPEEQEEFCAHVNSLVHYRDQVLNADSR